MTIETSISSVTYTGNGATTDFSFSFLIPEATDAVVSLTDIAGNSTETLDPSSYEISGLGDDAGGFVTYPLIGSPVASTHRLTIQRVLPLTQEVDLTNQDGFYPEVLEDALDSLCMQTQQVQEQINRAVIFPVGTDVNVPALTAAILAGADQAAAAEAAAAAAEAAAAQVLAVLPIGVEMMWPAAAAPSMWKIEDGSVLAQLSYPELFAVLGTTYNTGGEGAGNFRLPDKRDRVVQGKSGSTTLGQQVGASTVTLVRANLPNVTFTNSGIAISDTRTWTTPGTAVNNSSGAALGSLNPGAAIFIAPQAVTVSSGTITVSSQGTAASGGSDTPISVVQPGLVQNFIIYAGRV